MCESIITSTLKEIKDKQQNKILVLKKIKLQSFISYNQVTADP